MLRKLLLSICAVSAAFQLMAEVPTSLATAPAKIKIIGPLAVTKVADMDFGIISITSGTSSLVLPPAPGRQTLSITGDAVSLASSNPTAAKFSVSGQGNANFSINVPSSVTLSDIDGRGGGNIMVYISCDQPGSAPSFTSTLVDGVKEFYLGGTLVIGANQTPSRYSGSVTVNVDYN